MGISLISKSIETKLSKLLRTKEDCSWFKKQGTIYTLEDMNWKIGKGHWKAARSGLFFGHRFILRRVTIEEAEVKQRPNVGLYY